VAQLAYQERCEEEWRQRLIAFISQQITNAISPHRFPNDG
jgi:hypothetical protein